MSVFILSITADFYDPLKQTLELDQIQSVLVERWDKVLPHIGTNDPQLVVLNCPDSGVDGLNLCRQIRNSYQGLMLMITGESDMTLTILALEMGADVILPINAGTALIAAQIKALLRRFTSSEPLSVQTFGELTVDANKRDVFIAEQPVQLSTIEFNLLWLLVKQAGSVVSRENIHHDLYNSSYNGYDRGIDIYISRIRQKIGDNPVTPCFLKTVRGIGYQFVAASDFKATHPQ